LIEALIFFFTTRAFGSIGGGGIFRGMKRIAMTGKLNKAK
jgi:hypothetical protein